MRRLAIAAAFLLGLTACSALESTPEALLSFTDEFEEETGETCTAFMEGSSFTIKATVFKFGDLPEVVVGTECVAATLDVMSEEHGYPGSLRNQVLTVRPIDGSRTIEGDGSSVTFSFSSDVLRVTVDPS